MDNIDAMQRLTELWSRDDIGVHETIALEMAIKALRVQPEIKKTIITRIEQVRDRDKLCEYPYNRCIDIVKEVL